MRLITTVRRIQPTPVFIVDHRAQRGTECLEWDDSNPTRESKGMFQGRSRDVVKVIDSKPCDTAQRHTYSTSLVTEG